jgi:multidrug efflux pump subunit AcrA (membrane-fusion protein)
VLQRGELTAVYAVQDGRFVLKPVRLGPQGPDGVEVLAGLKPGERYALDAVRAGLADAKPAP